MSIARSLAVNTGIQLIGRIIATVLGIFIIGLLTRSLGQDGFGAYTAATAYLQFFALILDLGINVTFTAMLGEHADDEAYEKRCVSAIFTFRLVMVALMMTIAPLIWWFAFIPFQSISHSAGSSRSSSFVREGGGPSGFS